MVKSSHFWSTLVWVSGGGALRSYFAMAELGGFGGLLGGDFGDLAGMEGSREKGGKGGGKGQKRKMDEGESRAWLRVYETLPAQMLNAYGLGRYTQLTDAAVWEHMSKPLKTGALYMTEYASQDEDVAAVWWYVVVLSSNF